jgi:hypothetical protein
MPDPVAVVCASAVAPGLAEGATLVDVEVWLGFVFVAVGGILVAAGAHPTRIKISPNTMKARIAFSPSQMKLSIW